MQEWRCEGFGKYIAPLFHLASSTISRLLCTMKGFMALASALKRAAPSPPAFEVPNSSSKRGASRVLIMEK